MIRALLLAAAPVLLAQGQPGNHIFHDELLDQLVGRWVATGTVGTQPNQDHILAVWSFGHQFLQVHSRQVDGDYESEISIGWDQTIGRYVAHQLDSQGGRASEPVGFGSRTGDQIQLLFKDPQRLTRQTFAWNAKDKTWQFTVERQDRQGNWSAFVTKTLKKEAGGSDGRGRFGRGSGPRPDSSPRPPDRPAPPEAK